MHIFLEHPVYNVYILFVSVLLLLNIL